MQFHQLKQERYLMQVLDKLVGSSGYFVVVILARNFEWQWSSSLWGASNIVDTERWSSFWRFAMV